MITRKVPSPSDARAGSSATDAVLAEFCLDNTQCLVVGEDSPIGRSLGTDAEANARRLGCLDLGGRRYAVYARQPEPPETHSAPADDPLSSLTARELQIIRLVCLGCVNKQIAYKLRISEYTVKTYLKQIFCKLNVHSRSAMVYRCASWAMVETLHREQAPNG
jgi:DNA-binding CsgD family transcriptional regulator